MLKKVTTVLVAFSMVFAFFAPKSFAAQSTADRVIELAFKYSDSPYVYGGTSPSGFDCSGYTQYIFNKVGIDLHRTSRAQYSNGHAVSRSELQKGDLLFFNYYDGGSISHVGIYIGNNKMISAENERDDVTVASIAPNRYWGERMVGARRVIKEDVQAESKDDSLPAGHYHDVSNDYWAQSEIEYMSKQGIINGYDGDYFKPSNDVTRGEVAKMMTAALDLSPSSNNHFSDDNGHWAEKYINAVADAGYITGYENGTFKPDQAITRAEISALFKRSFNLQGAEGNFNDVPQNHWAYDEVRALVANDISTGYDGNVFKPSKDTTRAEFTVFLYRAIN
ncbi:S-layer homology domain-containing protein [Halobacillus yeomjeoni]|uniref:C40 family peptidase n=1 Tax=Halobacillus yeomjeoni TaxID=311194 RepID=UPI001CD6585B|nr:C40 family peptidase [Halobacillus yeomjeoni]MCA0985197.1 S-layer homology domain-containing protein [Halobacillus yeomjeoni]